MNTRNLIILAVIGILSYSCRDDFSKFDRPTWLEGKLYSQLLSIPDIDSFIVAVNRSGYDSILNSSGSYTIFAPENEAFLAYLQSAGFSSVWNIPEEDIKELVKVHIVQNPWSKAQLQTLDVNGWINKRDPNNDEPWGYKRQTLQKDPNRKYWITVSQNEATIVDSTESNEIRTVYRPSRKYLPLFFDGYLDVAEVSGRDFEFYFDRDYENGNIYFSSGKLGVNDYFAENGFIYTIDRVVSNLKNVEQLMENSPDGNSYSTFLNTVYLFPVFFENLEETYKQPGADQGLEVPTLYDLDYQDLTFDIHEELTTRGQNNVVATIRYHNGLLAPTNSAMQDLIDNVITDKSGYPHWPNYSLAPKIIKKTVVNSHMTDRPFYLTDLEQGFINGDKDSTFVNPENVIEKHYGSNATFVGIDKAIIPRAFTSVSGPVYLRPGYQTYMYAIEVSKILPAIKRRNASYSFFVLSEAQLRQDSSLFIRVDKSRASGYRVTSYDRVARSIVDRTDFDINLQMLNQVGEFLPKGIARKEFIPNLAGNYIVYNTEEIKLSIGTGDSITIPPPSVSGGVDNKYGFNGDSSVGVVPVLLDEPTDNGKTYDVTGWFSFSRTNLYNHLRSFNGFFNVMDRAGLVERNYGRLTFITDSDQYTIFVPSDRAIDSYSEALDTMSTEDLQKFVKYHFIPGTMIFTDGNKAPGAYETLRPDESSTIYTTNYTRLDITTLVDQIDLLDTSGELIFSVVENGSTTNIIAASDLASDVNLENYVSNGVIHEIDTVLIRH